MYSDSISFRGIPWDIANNLIECTKAWEQGRTCDGYPHPSGVASTLLAHNRRQPFLTVFETVNLAVLELDLRKVKPL